VTLIRSVSGGRGGVVTAPTRTATRGLHLAAITVSACVPEDADDQANDDGADDPGNFHVSAS
jgi:hypothetical protein